MKKVFLFALSMLVCGATVFAQDEDWRIHPDDAKYFIKGVFDTPTINGKTCYTLTDVTTQGVWIGDAMTTYYGQLTKSDYDDVQFTFSRVETECPTKYEYISYWVYDNEIKEWQPDIEIRNSDRGMENRKNMTVVLVLDCSSSMEAEFDRVREGATAFLKAMQGASVSGNISIGIIGFSSISRTQTWDIEPLTDSSCKRFIELINDDNENFPSRYYKGKGLTPSKGNGTALYYSLDKAIDMVNDYVKPFKDTDQYTRPIIITFTDGIDQTSRDEKKGIKNTEEYYARIKGLFEGSDIEHFIVPFQGSDIKTSAQVDKFERVLRSLMKPQDDEHYLPLKSMSELGNTFVGIANSLIDRWQVLRCYVAPARQGLVCWTFGKKGKEKVARTGRNIFLGLNGTLGVPWGEYTYRSTYIIDNYHGIGIGLNAGLDVAWSIGDKFAMGFYTSIGSGVGFEHSSSYYTDENESHSNDYMVPLLNFKVGLLMLAGDINQRPFIIGIAPGAGICWDAADMYLPVEIRFGRVLSKHFYMTGNLETGFPWGGFHINPSITLGYHFGDKIKTKGKKK